MRNTLMLLILILVASFSCSAEAGYVFETEMNYGGRIKTKAAIYLQDGFRRDDSYLDGSLTSSIIYNPKTKTSIFLYHMIKVYSDAAHIVTERSSIIDAYKPEKINVELKDTGKTEKIAGYKANMFLFGEDTTTEVWVVQDVPKDIVKTWNSLPKELKGLIGGYAEYLKDSKNSRMILKIASHFDQPKGSDKKNMNVVAEITKIETKNLPKTIFSIPNDYKSMQQQIDDMSGSKMKK